MTIKEKQQEKVREILFKYLLSDSLKPQYDGMSAYELAGIILKEAEGVEMDEMAKDACEKCGSFNGKWRGDANLCDECAEIALHRAEDLSLEEDREEGLAIT